jgi:DNA-binding MarR family transcriptional regulator
MHEMPAEPITFLILEVAKLIRRRFDVALETAGLGITAGEARTLLHVGRMPGRRQAALADGMNIEPMTLVGFLDRLEGAGLVVRQPQPGDRRAKLVSPTRKAAPLIRRIEEIAQSVRQQATEELGPGQVEALRSSLTAMRAALAADAAAEVA